MTTEIQFLHAPDVYVDNEVYVIGSNDGDRDIPLAGVTWLMQRERPRVAHLLTLKSATSLVLSMLPGYSLFLLAGHSAWQPDNRITRHRSRHLWSSLKIRELEIPVGQDLGEFLVESSHGIRYFGALQLEPGPLEATVKILHEQTISHLVALHPDRSGAIEPLIRSGWELPRRFFCPSWAVLKAVCGAGGVVFWPVGAFDDIEAGTVAFACPSVIDRLLSA